jgi:beta-glucosidase
LVILLSAVCRLGVVAPSADAQDASGGAAHAKLPVQSSADASRQERVDALIAKMTLEEKVSQMQNQAAAIPRLGIPAYDWWNEGLHGVARSGYATLFPQAIGMAATWDKELIHAEATAIGVEARAKYNQAIREGNHDRYYGLTVWSPNINIFRDPRWGRGQETYGEDPFLTGRLGVAFVSGLQGDDGRFLRVVSTPKHFAVHSGPESERHRFDVDPTPHDLEDTYLPAFRATVTEAHAQSVMCAYNAVDGQPACASKMLLHDLLRRDWKFNGFVTSDCAAITDIKDGHHFAADMEQAAVLAVRAGTDTSCGGEYNVLTRAVKDGLIAEAELDVSLRRLFLARFALGMFDPPASFEYGRLPFSQVDSAEHRQLALQTARESMVLLKNQGHLLPLRPDHKTIAVIGPNAAALAALEGNYNAVPSHPVTPLEGLRAALKGRAKVLYAQGSTYVETLPLPVPESVFRPQSGSEQQGLHAEYFNGTVATGVPAMTRTDRQINFDWNGGSPADGVTARAFAVRWTGTLTPPSAGDYTFRVSLAHCYPCHDAETFTMYLDGKLVAHQAWAEAEGRDGNGKPFTLHFDDATAHSVRMEYTHAAERYGAGITLEWQSPAQAMRDQAVQAAKASDLVVAFLGLSPELEGEEMPVKVQGFDGGDRTNLELPETQEALLESVAATGKPVVVVLMNGSALAVNWAAAHAAAVLEAWYPGEAGGTAIAETLLGQNNPGGRLPVTFYKSIDQLPAFTDYRMQNRTYRYSKATPLYKFGEGMSYTEFQYSKARLAVEKITAGESAEVKVHVTNAGAMDGDEVVEVYLTPPPMAGAPLRALVGFERIHLAKGESRDVAIKIPARQLSLVDANGARSVQAGRYTLYVGGRQPSPGEQGLPLEIVGAKMMPEGVL